MRATVTVRLLTLGAFVWVVRAVGPPRDGRILTQLAPQDDDIVLRPPTPAPTDVAGWLTRIVLDRYLSHPLAVVVDTEPTTLRRTQTFWNVTLGSVHTNVALTLVPYSESGTGTVFKTETVAWFLQALNYLQPASILKDGLAFYSILKASEQVAIDSAVLIFTARQATDEDLAQLTVNTLMHKRCQLHVFWCGPAPSLEAPGVEQLYREVAEQTGGMFHVAFPHEAAVVFKPGSGSREDKSKEVTLAVMKGVAGSQELLLKVDSTVDSLLITIAGPIRAALLLTPTGEPIDLRRRASSGGGGGVGVRVLANTDDATEVRVDSSSLPPGVWKLRTTEVARDRLYNVSVTAASRLTFSATIHTSKQPENSRLRLMAVEVGEIADVTLVDEHGKELHKLTYQRRDEPMTGSNGHITTELDLPTNIRSSSPIYVKLSGQDQTGAEFTRLSLLERQFQVTPGLLSPVTIDLAANSTLNVLPNYWAQLVFQVTNNRNTAQRYFFSTRDDKGFVRNIQPTQFVLGPQLTVDITVSAIAPAMTPYGTIDTLTLIVQTSPSWTEPVAKSALITIGDRISDYERPKIWTTMQTDCKNFLSPNTCQNSVWSTEITIEDRYSGLLRVTSVPRGIQFRTEFVSGTKSPVIAYYSATCCDTRLDVTATDIMGNYFKYYVNADNTYYGLMQGEIAAIVLGILLLAAIILIIILAVCMRRNRRSRDLPVRSRSTH